MLGSDARHDWLFLCDTYGAVDNGTYYTGRAGDLFVERAMIEIISGEMGHRNHGFDRVVTLGSSMGATGALTMGLHFDVAGIITVCPHVDLDTCARMCDKYEEVAFSLSRRRPLAADNFWITHRIRNSLDGYGPSRQPPLLFVQSVADDVGVHNEQVLPLVDAWAEHGGDRLPGYPSKWRPHQ